MNESLLPSALINGEYQLDELFAIEDEKKAHLVNFLFDLFSFDANTLTISPFNGIVTQLEYSEINNIADKIQRVLDSILALSQDLNKSKTTIFYSSNFLLEISYIIVYIIHLGFDEVNLNDFIVNLIKSFETPPENLIRIVLSNFKSYFTYFIEDFFNFLVTNQIYENRSKFLFDFICAENETASQLFCEFCIRNKTFPRLFFPIIANFRVQSNPDWFLYTLASLFSFNQKNDWFDVYFKGIVTSDKLLYISFIENLTVLSQGLLLIGDDDIDDRQKIVQRITFFNIILYLRSNFEIAFYPGLSGNLLKLITLEESLDEFNVEVVKFSICFFIYVRPMLVNEQAQPLDESYTNIGIIDQTFNEFLRNVISSLRDKFKAGLDRRPFADILFLINVLFQNNSIAISENIKKILRFKLNSLGRLISATKKIFNQNQFNEKSPLDLDNKFPITYDLNDKIEGYLPIHYVLSVFQSNNTIRWNHSISDWIYEQLTSIKTPIHSAIPELIDVYVQNIITGKSGLDPVKSLIPMKKICQIFVSDDEILQHPDRIDIAKNVVMAYYALVVLNNHQTVIAQNHEVHNSLNEYFSRLTHFNRIPLGFLINYCQNNLKEFQRIYPSLIELTLQYFPHMLKGENIIEDRFILYQNSDQDPLQTRSETLSTVPDLQRVSRIIDAYLELKMCSDADSLLIVDCIDYFYKVMQSTSVTKLLGHVKLICGKFLGLFLETDSFFSRHWRFSHKFITIWKKIHLVMPIKIQEISMNWLLNNGKQLHGFSSIKKIVVFKGDLVNYDYNKLVEDPIENILTRIDKRVFRSPQLFTILVRVLESTLCASKAYWNHRVNNSQLSIKATYEANEEDPKKLKNALLITQDISVIQLLLEVCLPTRQESSCISKLHNLRKIQLEICSFIHNMFIADPYLVDIIHWHLYPPQLLEMVCSGIPSMHILLDNLPELVRLCGNLEKLVFYAKLIAKMSKYYNLRITSERTSIILTVIDCLASFTPKKEFHPAIEHILPSLVEVSSYLPNISNEALRVIRNLSLIANSVGDDAVYEATILASVKIAENSLLTKSIHF